MDEFLRKKIATVAMDDGDIPPPPASESCTLENALVSLKAGYNIISVRRARTLHISLNYGLWLNLAYKVFEYSKGQGTVTGSWNQWLTTNVGISQSYCRQLRDLSTKFSQYKNIHYLSISIKELYKIRYEIIHMMNSDKNIAAFWLGTDN